MDSKVKDVYTKDPKKSKDKKKRVLQTSGSNSAGASGAKKDATKTDATKATNATKSYKPNATELAKEKKLKERDPLKEINTFKAVTFAGMCVPCTKKCTKCPDGFVLKENGNCAKGCDRLSEELVVDPTTKVKKCKKDNKPRLKIVWGSKKDEKDLMDDE